MWLLLGWVLLLPIGWALLGATSPGGGPADLLVAAGNELSEVMPGLADTVARLEQGLADTAVIDRLLGPTPVPTTAWVLAALVLGAVLALAGLRAPVHVATMVHEVGHGLVAAALGARVLAMVTSSDGSGHVRYQFRGAAALRVGMAGLMGYPFPGILAVASLRAALAGSSDLWLGYLVGLMAVMLAVALRSWWAAWVAIALAGTALVALAVGLPMLVAAGVVALAGALAAQGSLQAHAQWTLCRKGRRCDATLVAGQRRALALGIAGSHVLAAWILAAALPWLALGGEIQSVV